MIEYTFNGDEETLVLPYKGRRLVVSKLEDAMSSSEEIEEKTWQKILDLFAGYRVLRDLESIPGYEKLYEVQ